MLGPRDLFGTISRSLALGLIHGGRYRPFKPPLLRRQSGPEARLSLSRVGLNLFRGVFSSGFSPALTGFLPVLQGLKAVPRGNCSQECAHTHTNKLKSCAMLPYSRRFDNKVYGPKSISETPFWVLSVLYVNECVYVSAARMRVDVDRWILDSFVHFLSLCVTVYGSVFPLDRSYPPMTARQTL
jgi:hypothetical protein